MITYPCWDKSESMLVKGTLLDALDASSFMLPLWDRILFIPQEKCTQFMLCYILLWLATDLFNYILKRFFNDEIVL